MKFKTIVKASGVIVVIGILFTGIGYAINGGFPRSIKTENNVTNYKTENTNMISKSENIDNFKNINMYIEAMNVEIIPSNEYKIEIKYRDDGSKIHYEVSKDTLNVVQENSKKYNLNSIDFNDKYSNSMKVYVPKGTKFDNLNIDCNVSSIEFSNLEAKNVDLSCDLGNIEISHCSFDEISLETNAGSIEVDNMKALKAETYSNLGSVSFVDCDVNENFQIDTDMGNVEVDAKLYGTIDIVTNLGNVELFINDSKDKYSYRVKNDLGGFEVDGKVYSRELEVDNNSNNSINLQCNAGNIDLSFR